MAWSKNGTTTLSSAGDTVTVSSLTASEFNHFMMHGLWTGTTLFPEIRVGNGSVDTGSNYAYRSQADGAADTTGTSQTSLPQIRSGADLDHLTVGYFINIETEEKLFIYHTAQTETSGAGTAPTRREIVGKWVNTSNQIDTIQSWDNGGTSTFASDSNLTVLNGDATEETILTNVQSGSRFEATDTRKIYYGAPALKYETDFSSSTGWSFQDTNKINIATNRLNYQAVTDGSNDSASYDLGTVSDTKWILRFRYSMTAQSLNGTGYAMFPVMGISDSDDTVSEVTSQKGIAFAPYQEHVVGKYFVAYADGDRLGGNYGSGNTRITIFSETANTGDDYYIELKRTSATNVVASIYSDSGYSTLVETKSLTIPSTITGLKYFVVKNFNSTSTQSGSQTGWIDDLKFYNEATSVTDFVWTEEA